MKEKDLKKLVSGAINSDTSIDLKTYEWDSLIHLTILMELEKTFPNKITSINGIADINNFNELKKILISKNILIND
tara:strand:- start:210 stop:437 length:228 start_codon:yes stop_codon:yes gene_type:complete